MNTEQRLEALQTLITQIREKEFPYEERPEKKTDWSLYDLAQCSELGDMLLLIGRIVDVAASRLNTGALSNTKNPGRPAISVSDVVKVLLAQTYFGFSNRRSEGLVRVAYGPLGLCREFSYKTIERGYDPWRTGELLDVVMSLTNEPVRRLENIFGIDGTGQPTSIKQNYENDRRLQRTKKEGQSSVSDKWPASQHRTKHGYVYGVGIIGTVSKIYAAWKSNTDRSKGELRFFKELIQKASVNRPVMDTLAGDGLYATRKFCQACDERGIVPITLPRRNVTLRRKGVYAWVEMLLFMLDSPQEYLEQYHLRSISETGNSMLVAYYPQPIRKRFNERKELESDLRIVVHNIRRLCALAYLVNLQLKFNAQMEMEDDRIRGSGFELAPMEIG
jgi:transposase